MEKSDIAKKEEEILKFWQENKIFEQTLTKPAPGGDFVFYDGPPFATGLPHFGHLLPTSIKDAIPRYQTMRGKRVLRQWGWDCHGLPIENLIEKELDLKTKKDIEKYGLALFNQKARASVLRYAEEWKKIIPRLGRWVDMENDYKTMDPTYTESVWWVFKSLYDKGLVYEGYKSMHLCPRCETTLANFEVNLGYKDITDLSVYVKFELVDEPGTYLLAWTTTPWTLPGNTALAVNQEIIYSKLKVESEFIILAKDKIGKVLRDKKFEIVEELSGKDLVDKKYQPLFNYYQGSTLMDAQSRTLKSKNGWQVYSADFVTTEEGTGIVHIAPAFGEADMKLGEEKNLPFIQHVSRDGKFKPEVTDFSGLPVKPKDDHQATDILIIKYLVAQNSLFRKEKVVHSYPHCWRCDTPLLNYAASSWFIKVMALKEKLLAENQKINWVPEHIKDGRFGKWLAGARDWAVSRQRFWGAPLPVWHCDKCKKVKIIGSLEELKKNTKTSGNHYFVMRHGESENNLLGINDCVVREKSYGLTEIGRKMVKEAALALRDKDRIDLIFYSPLRRTKETAFLVAEVLGIESANIKEDEHLIEYQSGDFNGLPYDDLHNYYKDEIKRFTKAPPNGETFLDLIRRLGAFAYSLEEEFKGKKILIITHGDPGTLIQTIQTGFSHADIINYLKNNYLKIAEVSELDFTPLPHNADYKLDFHRPFIDEIRLVCDCGGEMKRIEDVFDVWFESGSMPYGQVHYPFNPDKRFPFPADFIAEGVDQTRGWFYSLLVLGVGLFNQSPYKNVIVNGLILAEDGQKMSKRLNNYPDLNLTIDKYGADALRFYLLSSPSVRAEDFGFSERGLGEVMRRVIMRLKNVLVFYQLYAPINSFPAAQGSPTNLLDIWMRVRLTELNQIISQAFDSYEIDRVGKPIDEFVDDLSTWYLRRSRDRFREVGGGASVGAIETLRQILITLTKIIAPIIPFVAEEIYQVLRSKNDLVSVHLESWPEVGEIDVGIISQMSEVRRLVSLALEERAKAGIKIRQPLQAMFINGAQPSDLSDEFILLIKEEVNVKEVKWQNDLSLPVQLEFTITAALREEGEVRGLVRQIQDLRKAAGLTPRDTVIIRVATTYPGRAVIEAHQAEICRAVNATSLFWEESGEGKTSIRLERA